MSVPGYLINVHVPDEGKPDKTTLPVDKMQVGAVIAPTNGAGGIGGCEFTKTFSDGIDRHPDELVTVNE
jgi:hypothetical protein